MTHRLKTLVAFIGVFTAVYLLFCAILYVDARLFTPMPDNDADLAAWGMRYALIPGVAFLYTVAIFILSAIVKFLQTIRNRSASDIKEI